MPTTVTDNWIKLTVDTIPIAKQFVWIKRKSGSMYLGYRLDKPLLATNPDASQDCWWYGNPLDHATEINNGSDWHPHNHFSDVTVEAYMPLQPPQ